MLALILAIRMALQAVVKIADVFFLVFLGNLSFVVAEVTTPLLKRWLVTGRARVVFLAVFHREGVRASIRRRGPPVLVMTVGAARIEHAGMKLGFSVAAFAIRRCAFVFAVFMAGPTPHAQVITNQLER